MMTLSQLLAATSSDKQNFRRTYSLDTLKVSNGVDARGSFWQFAAIALGGKTPRKPIIQLYGDDFNAGSPCKVGCNCKYFMYKLAIPLARHDTTDVHVDEDTIPEKYRDTGKPALCPHLLVLAQSVLNEKTTEMKRLRRISEARNTRISDRLRRLT